MISLLILYNACVRAITKLDEEGKENDIVDDKNDVITEGKKNVGKNKKRIQQGGAKLAKAKQTFQETKVKEKLKDSDTVKGLISNDPLATEPFDENVTEMEIGSPHVVD